MTNTDGCKSSGKSTYLSSLPVHVESFEMTEYKLYNILYIQFNESRQKKNDIFGALFKLRNQYGPYSMGILKLNVKRAQNISMFISTIEWC